MNSVTRRTRWLIAAAAMGALTTAATGQNVIKWEQPPDPQLSGLHAHDWDDGAGPMFIVLADDWICEGGLVTDFHWWGAYELDADGHEIRGQGIAMFHLSMHDNQPAAPFDLPMDPEFWFMDVPFDQVNETPTGLFNPMGAAIYRYDFILPDPFPQVEGQAYWFDLFAISVNPTVPALWLWQEANRSPVFLGHAPAAERMMFGPWHSIIWSGDPPRFSDMAFAVTSEGEPQLQACCLVDGTCIDLLADQCMEQGGEPQGVGTDCTTIICSDLKWLQLPNPGLTGLHAHDWESGGEPQFLILADDWVCEGGLVTDLHWWGNYETDAAGNELRGAGILFFHLSIHLNMPAIPFGLPLDPEVWIFDVPFAEVNETPTGLVSSDGSPIYRYDFVLPEPFPQIEGQTYWFDLFAISENLFDPAIWRWQEANRSSMWLGTAPGAERSAFGPWHSIIWFGNPDKYSDLAFAVTSEFEPVLQACCLPDGHCADLPYDECVALGGDPQGPGTVCIDIECNPIKWAQPPVFNSASPHPECFWGWDEMSWFAGPRLMADDWRCVDANPVTDIHWWGAYDGWSDIDPPPFAPELFHIGIWTDVPAGVDFPFSHPGIMLHEWVVPREMLNERPVACLQHPDFMDEPIGVYRYDFIIPFPEWFYQQPMEGIYWVSIGAIYPAQPPEWPWGWITRPHYFQDDAVAILMPTDPVPGIPFMEGYPIEDFGGATWDLAFVLTTTDCRADLDGDGQVGFSDLVNLLASWGPNPGNPADMDGDGQVGFSDLVSLLAAWGPCP